MTLRSGPVVVGVNGSALDEGALRAGVAEAHRLGVGITLVHVVPDYVSVSPLLPITPTDLDGLGSEVVARAAKLLREIDPEIAVNQKLEHGSRTKRLAEAAAQARALVVGRDDRSLAVRLLRGNAATGVAAVAVCPVLAVPAGWQPVPRRGQIVVGMKSRAHSPELLEDAFALASALGDKLVLLHAWRLPTGYDDIIESRVAVDQWSERIVLAFDALVKDFRTAYPDVDVEIRAVHDRPVSALVEASRDADALVIVRRSHGVPAAVLLGGTARAVLRSAYCPVRVVPAALRLDALPGLVLEEAGALAK
ncbi:universal stress protein [Nocardioides endophyticus]|uniref:Universal stress protein n=1 Tax=Nocardioides endophyticus TaxID=1353775 RepID=A0ABP8Z1S7_9ACTN